MSNICFHNWRKPATIILHKCLTIPQIKYVNVSVCALHFVNYRDIIYKIQGCQTLKIHTQ